MNDSSSGLTQNIMTDSYTFQHRRRLTGALRTALLSVVVLLFAIPASGQRVHQFTGNASVEINDVAQPGTPVVRIEVLSSSTGTEPGAGGTFATLSGGTIWVDGVAYTLDVSAMTIRRPNADNTDGSTYDTNATTPGPNRGVALEYPGIALHHAYGVGSGNFYHYFKGNGGVLTLPQTSLAGPGAVSLNLVTEEGHLGLIDPGATPLKGYPYTNGGGGRIELSFTGGLASYSEFGIGGAIDYGDAPDGSSGSSPGNYKTTAADGGPSHFVGGPILGSVATDADSGTLQNVGATADDLDGSDDETGVSFTTSLVASAGQANTATLTIEISNGPGLVDAWIDFNQNGLFDPVEKVMTGMSLANGFHQVPVTIPAGATPGTTYARFRISTTGTTLPFGSAADGELEDYQVTILNGAGANPIGVNLGAGGIVQPITITKTPGGDTNVKHAGALPNVLFSAPSSAVGALTVTGTSGNDNFIVDYVNGSPSNGPITVDGAGQAGVPGDNLTLQNGTQDTIHHTYYDPTAVPVNNYSGKIEYIAGVNPPLQTVNYVKFEPIIDLLVAAHRIFTFSAVANAVKFDYVAGVGPSIIQTIPVTSEHTTFTNPTVDMVINGLGGADTFDIEPSLSYPITVNGDAPSTFIGGDTFNLDAGSLPPATVITLTETSNNAGIYTFDMGVFPMAYNTMEIVGLRYSDPNALPLATYPGDFVYPIHTETGISIEPYFNWDIENWPLTPLTVMTSLKLDVSLNSDLSSPVFTTLTKNDATPLLLKLPPNTDHYITDVDLNAGIPLLNNTTYYWGLTATLAGGATFRQISRFKTIPALLPSLTYPKDMLTIPALNFDFHWNVASPTSPSVYWRIDVDKNIKAAFNGSTPFNVGGNIKNDDNKLVTDGYAATTQFSSSNLAVPLTWGTTYSWRTATMWPVAPTGWVPQEVFDKNETDRMVSISSIFQFQTQTLAFVPTPSYPTGGLTVPSNTPLLSWWVGGPFGALTFNLEIREAGSLVPYCNIPTWPTGIVGTQFNTSTCSPALIAGKNYEWRVQSTDGTTTSAFSAWAAFSTNGQGVAVAATPSYPIGNLQIYTINPQLHWFTTKDNTGISFIAHYAKRPILPGTAPASCAVLKAIPNTVPGDVFDLASPLSTTYVDALGLQPGATYDWCVTSTGLNGSFESGVATFGVAGGLAKNFPVASWPKPNPTVYGLSQLLTWYLEGSYFDVVSYDVEYCKGIPTGATPVFGAGGPSCTIVTGILPQQYNVTGLVYGDVVKWRVRANYTSGPPSDWTLATAQGGFTVTGLLTSLAANLTYPAGNVIIYTSSPTFSWWVSGGVNVANSFKIQYSYAETFPIIGTVTIETFSTVPFLNVTGLIPGHTYWWRVAVSNDGGVTYGAWSTVASFAVHPGASAVMPRIGSPANTVTIATNAPTLSWLLPSESTSSLTYELRYSRNENLESGATVVKDLTQRFVELNNLPAGTYYWQVRSKTANGEVSPYSPVGVFTTTASFSVGTEDEIYGELPTSFELGQNYPNPFNPSTSIEFRMSESANVTLRIYNVLGQVVKTLVNGTLPSGVHNVTWDARDEAGMSVSSGLYLYRMETTGFTATKSLVLMK